MRVSQLVSRCSVVIVAGAVVAGASAGQGFGAELSRTAFSRYATEACPGIGTCEIDFGTVPGGAKRRYEITHVSCSVVIGNAAGKVGFWFLHAFRNGQPIGNIHLRPHALGVFASGVRYSATEQANLIVRGGSQIVVVVSRDGTSGNIPSTDCTMSGYDVTLE